MLRLDYHVYRLPLRFPSNTSNGPGSHQPTLIVSLSLGKLKGHGEATSIGYYNADIEEMIVCLEKKKRTLESYALNGPERFWHFLHHLFPGQDFLISALDCAGWDLWAQLNRRPLYAMIGLAWKNVPLNGYTIGKVTPEEVLQRARHNPSPVYRLELGDSCDLDRLLALREAAPDAEIRIDAQESWSVGACLELLPRLEKAGVTVIEQPLPAADREGLAIVRSHTSITLIADEACRTVEDAVRCLDGHYDGINVKLSKHGGLSPALEILKMIKKAKAKVMLGTMGETIPGATILSHLLPLSDYADIDGPSLLTENIGTGIEFDGPMIRRPVQVPGAGIMM